jgi:hypothetical protein
MRLQQIEFAVAGLMPMTHEEMRDEIRMSLAVGIMELKGEVKKLHDIIKHENIDARKVCTLAEWNVSFASKS